MPWVYNPHRGGKTIPPHVQGKTERRILAFAEANYPGKFIRIGVRFRGALCYIDAYLDPGIPDDATPPPGESHEEWVERLRNAPMHLCRIRYNGNEESWSFAYYNYSNEKYEPSFLMSGDDHGTVEEAFETSALFL